MSVMLDTSLPLETSSGAVETLATMTVSCALNVTFTSLSPLRPSRCGGSPCVRVECVGCGQQGGFLPDYA